MAVYVETDCPQTLYAASRQAKTSPQWCWVRGNDEGPAIAVRMILRLRAAGFGVSDIGHDRVLVTRGEVDVDALWRRAQRDTRDMAVRDHVQHARWVEGRMAKLAREEADRREVSRRQLAEAERAAEDAELAGVRL